VTMTVKRSGSTSQVKVKLGTQPPAAAGASSSGSGGGGGLP
jgi:hypothetical protein